MAKGLWSSDHQTYITMLDIPFQNHGHWSEIVPPPPLSLQLKQPPLFWEGFPQDLEVCLWKFMLTPPLNTKRAFVRSDTDVHFIPKGVPWGWGHGYVQAYQVPPHQSHKTISSCGCWMRRLGSFQIIPKMFSIVEIRALFKALEFLNLISPSHVFIEMLVKKTLFIAIHPKVFFMVEVRLCTGHSSYSTQTHKTISLWRCWLKRPGSFQIIW